VVLSSSLGGFHRLFATRPVSSETIKQFGDQVLTMVLFGTWWPIAFSGAARGPRVAWRDWNARGTQCLNYQLSLALDPECLKNPANHRQNGFPGAKIWHRILRQNDMFLLIVYFLVTTVADRQTSNKHALAPTPC